MEGGGKRTISKKDLEEASSSSTSPKRRKQEEAPEDSDIKVEGGNSSGEDEEVPFHCGVDIVQLGVVAMDAEEFRKLHEAIKDGDVNLVSRLMENHAAEQYFLHEETSALFHAFSEKRYDIAAHLISKGAKIHDSEMDDLYDLEIDLTRVNHLLKHSNKKSDKSCIFRLISLSQSPQGLDGKHLKAVISMYENFFESETIKLLMMVLETVVFDIFYDFESEDVNRLYRLEAEEMEIYGLTLSNSKEIYVGAKNLISGDTEKRAKVYGVMAEELCHLAMTTLFENGAKPYRKEQSKLTQDFWNIITAVESLAGRSCQLESSIKTIFTDYDERHWECELIARVPYVIGFYGEATARGILMESSELSRLLSFYEENVIPKCREYTDPRHNTKPHRIMEELMEKHNLISSEEKRIKPLKSFIDSFSEYLEDFPSFPEYPELKREGIFVLTTNCTKLCTLHVFHELKEKYGDLLKKKVLFLSRKCIKGENDKIINALKGNVWDYLIIVMNKKALNLCKFNIDYQDFFNEFLIKGMKIIMITSSQSTDQMFNFEMAVNYKWDDLTDEYKSKLEIIHFLFKGQEEYVYVEKGDFPKYFNEDEIMQIIGEVIEVDDGKDLYSQGYIPETYVERAFTATTVDGEFFDNIPRDTSVFLSGFSKKDFEEGLISKVQVQWMEKSDDKLQEDKSVYISRGSDFSTFMDLVEKNSRKATIWLHHEKSVFYLKNSNSTSDEFKRHTKEASFSEIEILDFLKSKRILIISDNAGCGKSTVVSNLISTVRKNRSDSWIWRIDFNKFSNSENDPLSLAKLNQNSNDEQVFDYLCQMLKLNGGFEKHLFKQFSCRAGRCFIFFDGYDEIPSNYMNRALKILSTLKEKTAVKLIITTRKHHQEELEKTLDTYSHRLVPLSKEYQIEFMNKLWKNKLKDPKGKGHQRSEKEVTEKIQNIIDKSKKKGTVLEYQALIDALKEIDMEKSLKSILSDIENLDFTKFAEYILEKSSLDEETLEFIGIPLHLYMIGDIHFNDNFNIETAYDFYSLYNEFLRQKILIYIEEKQNLRKEGKLKEKLVKNTRIDAFRINTELSIQLIDDGKVCLATELDEDELELCTGLGVVYEHGGEIRFIHQTFAEFFIAESVRKTLRKEDIIKLISDDKYKVIRRFLSSSLENNDFGEISKVFLKISCLSDVMERAKILTIRYNSDSYCAAKIIKNLLVNFEQKVEVSVVNKLFEKIEQRIESMSHVGGFLTVSMMKHLLNRNFEVNSILFLHFVRFAESVVEVIDVLNECIPFGSDGGPGSSLHKRSKRRRKNTDKEETRLVLLLSQKDNFKYGLIHNALSNERFEISAQIFKFFRDHLGKEQFLERITKSDEYVTEIDNFMFDAGINKFCNFIKALHNVFDNETEILLDNDLKFRLIWNSFVKFDHEHGKVHSFQKVISIFQECFVIKHMKEFLLSSNSSGNYLIHIIMQWGPRTQTVKYLNVVQKVFNDNCTMKQFLRSKDKNLNNALHLAASKEDKYFVEIIQFFGKYLDKEEMKETLLCKNKDDCNVIETLFYFSSSKILIDNLNSVKEFIGDEYFKALLKIKGSDIENIFHMAAIKDKILDDIIQFCDNILGKEETKELLLCKDKNDRNVIHFLILFNSSELLIDNLNSVKEFIGDECLKDLLKSKGSDNENIFHFAARKKLILEGIIQYCDNILGKEETKEMLLTKDNNDRNVIHFLFFSYSSKTLIDNLNSVKEFIGDECFKHLLKSKDWENKNIFHIAAFKDKILDDIIQYCDNILGKEETKEMLLTKDNNDCNVIHFLFCSYSSKTLIDNLNSVKEFIGDECFKDLLKSKDWENKNIFHIAAFKDKILDDIIQYCDNILGKEEIKEMLLSKNKYDCNAIHFLFFRNSSKTLIYNLNSVKEFIGDECFKDLLKSKLRDNENIFHFAASKELILEGIIQICDSIIGKEETKELLLCKDKNDRNVIHFLILFNSSGVLIENLDSVKEFIGDECFKDLLKSKDSDNENIFHLAARKELILEGLIQYCDNILGKEETKEMLLTKDNNDCNVIHFLILFNTSELFIDNLDSVKEFIGDECFKDLLKSKDSDNENIFHFAARNELILEGIIQYCDNILGKEETKEMLLTKDNNDCNVIQFLLEYNSPERITDNLNSVREFIGDEFL